MTAVRRYLNSWSDKDSFEHRSQISEEQTATHLVYSTQAKNFEYLQVFKECNWRWFRQRRSHGGGCQKMWGSLKAQRGDGGVRGWRHRSAVLGTLPLRWYKYLCVCFWRVCVWKEWSPRLCKDNVLQNILAQTLKRAISVSRNRQNNHSALNLMYS